MTTTLLLLAGGLVALVAGGDLLVRGAVGMARRFGVSPLLIGLTLVGFGTSTPELVTSVEAALAGSPGIAVGNVVGSNICNILLILGIAAMLQPMPVARAVVQRDGSVMMAATLAVVLIVPFVSLTRPVGLVLVLALVGYVLLAYWRDRAETRAMEPEGAPSASLRLLVPLTLAGIALTILGAHWLVLASIDLARSLDVSESLIGLTVAAVGTSLPELVTSVVAAVRRQADVALGNIVGSNIFNLLGILGVTALVSPMALPDDIAGFDIWVMLAATTLLVLVCALVGRLGRATGGALLAGYAAYLIFLATQT